MIEEANNNFDSNESSGFYDVQLGSSNKNNHIPSSAKKSVVFREELDLEERSDL